MEDTVRLLQDETRQRERDLETFLQGITPKKPLGDVSNYDITSSPRTPKAELKQQVPPSSGKTAMTKAKSVTTSDSPRTPVSRVLVRSASSPLVLKALAVSSPKATLKNSPHVIQALHGNNDKENIETGPVAAASPVVMKKAMGSTDATAVAPVAPGSTAFSLPKQVAMLSKALLTSNDNLETCHNAIQHMLQGEKKMKKDFERRLHLAKVARVRERTHQRVRIHKAKDRLQKEMQQLSVDHHNVVSDLTREIASLRTLSETDRSQYLEIERKWQDVTRELVEKDSELARITDKLASRDSENDVALADVNEQLALAQTELAKREADVAARDAETASLREAIADRDETIAKLRTEVDDGLELRVVSEAEAEHLQKKLAAAQQELDARTVQESAFAETEARFVSEINDAKSREKALLEQVTRVQAEVDSLRASDETWRTKTSSDAKKSAILAKRCEQLEKEAQKSSAEVTFLTTQKKTLESRLETELKRWQALLEDEIQRAKVQGDEAARITADLTSQIDVLQQTLTSEKLEASALRDELAQVKRRKSNESEIKAVLDAERLLTKEMREADRAEIVSLEKQLAKVEGKSIVQHAPLLHSLTREVSLLKGFLADLKREMAEMPVTAAKEMQQYEQQFHTALSASREEAERLSKVSELRAAFMRERSLRRKLHNKLQELCGNIRVFCRVRPALTDAEKTEVSDGEKPTLRVMGEEQIVLRTAAGKMRNFHVDRVFGAQSTQRDIFEEVQPMITSVLDGFNVCIMAYGQTGSGKTHTMQGSSDMPGLIPRCADELFALMEERKDFKQFTVQLTMVELYNEKVRDLLDDDMSGGDEDKKRCDIVSGGAGADRATYVTNITTKDINDASDVAPILAQGHVHRAQRSTDMNDTSSRSHCVVTLTVTGKDEINGSTTRAQLTLVDLAGSECVGKTGTVGQGLREAKNINRSLASLGDVLGALAQKKSHIPYRNSKLTTLLRDFLGGDAKMLLCVTVPPTKASVSETARAISFGVRAMQTERGQAQAHTTTE